MQPERNVFGLHEARSAASRGVLAPDDELLTRRQVCSRLGISATTLWRYQQRGWLVPVKYGAARSSPVRFRRSDVDRFLALSGGQV